LYDVSSAEVRPWLLCLLIKAGLVWVALWTASDINYPVLMADKTTTRNFDDAVVTSTSFRVNRNGHAAKEYPGFAPRSRSKEISFQCVDLLLGTVFLGGLLLTIPEGFLKLWHRKEAMLLFVQPIS
jgi:hypothetical protein